MIRRYNQNEVDKLAEILKHDGVISVPTDTVYGVCAIINSVKAHDRLMEVKNRPTNKSFPIMCADEKQIKSIAIVDEKAEKLIHAFMPGPYGGDFGVPVPLPGRWPYAHPCWTGH